MRKSILLYFLFFIFTSSGVLSANANFEESLLQEQNVDDDFPVVRLKKRKSLLRQLTSTNVRYIIRHNYNLKGETLVVPDNCILDFRGGHIFNGIVNGNNTQIYAGNEQIFGSDIKMSGTWLLRQATSRWFHIGEDATSVVSWLLEMGMRGIPIEFDKSTYKVKLKYDKPCSYPGYRNSAFVATDQVVDISFNGSTIIDAYSGQNSVNFITLDNCSGQISGLYFQTGDDDYDIYADDQYGVAVVQCINSCHELNLQVSAKYVRSCVEAGRYDWHSRSLVNSTIIAELRDGGYAVALYDGDNLNVDIDASHVHRGAYLGGCKNSRINVNCGKTALGVACYLTDTRLIVNGKKTYLICDNLDVTTKCYGDSGDNVDNVVFAAYNIGDFNNRKDVYSARINVVSNIEVPSSVGNVRIFNILDSNHLDTLRADVHFNVRFTDDLASNKYVVLYNNGPNVTPHSYCFSEVTFKGKSSQPLVARLQNSGGYNIVLDNVYSCVGNSLYSSGQIELLIGSRFSDSDVCRNVSVVSSDRIYVRRENINITNGFPVIINVSESPLFFSDQFLLDKIQLQTEKTISLGNPTLNTLASKLYVERYGGDMQMSIIHPNGKYYWATKGQKLSFIIKNLSTSDEARITFDKIISAPYPLVKIPPLSYTKFDLIYDGNSQFHLISIVNKNF